MAGDADTVTKLEELLAAISAAGDPRRAGEQWKQAYRLLSKTALPPGRVNGVVGMRDPAGLRELIDLLRLPDSPPAGQTPSPETLKRALLAFRKRSRLTRLDDESKINSHSPLSKGADPDAAAITPPNDFPPVVWQELVRQGRLRYVGHGLYELAKQ